MDEKRRYLWIEFFLIFSIIIVIFSIILLIFSFKEDSCGDGTFYEECSAVKPYFCGKGILIEKASICGCSNISIQNEDKCVSGYQIEPKNLSLKYILRGEEKKINLTVYNGMIDYLSNLSPFIEGFNGTKVYRSEFKLRNINNREQRELLLPLVIKIQNEAKDKTEQMRIAVSIVQNLDYGQSEKPPVFRGLNYSRYPYEVLYDVQGICGEKSELLSFILKELGYGVAIFYYPSENHESVGVKCPIENSLDKTGYCFVETTAPAIINDDKIGYVGGITLNSKPEIILISEGESLPENLPEYKDAETMKKIRAGKFVFFRDSKLEDLKEKYGLVEEYNLG